MIIVCDGTDGRNDKCTCGRIIDTAKYDKMYPHKSLTPGPRQWLPTDEPDLLLDCGHIHMGWATWQFPSGEYKGRKYKPKARYLHCANCGGELIEVIRKATVGDKIHAVLSDVIARHADRTPPTLF